MHHCFTSRRAAGCVTALLLFALVLLTPSTPKAHAESTLTRPPAASYQVLQDRGDRLVVALPNRLVVIAQELHTTPIVSTQVWVRTGSIFEQEHVGAGLSHYLEHLVSGGSTANRSEAESNTILGQIGAATNAATSLDTVRYYIDTTAPFAGQAVDLLSDWLQNSLVTPAEFARERDVIFREFEMGRGDPGRIFWKLTQQARYVHHPARHPTIGYLDEFRTITRDELYGFYKRMYVPNNMVFVVVGDIDRHAMVKRIADRWKHAKPGKLPELSFPIETGLEGARQMTGTADIDRARLRLAWPGTRLAGRGDYALDLLGVVLGQGEASRLTRTVRDQQGLVNSIDAYNLSFAWGEGFFGIDAEIADAAHADAAPEKAGVPALVRVKVAILEQVDRIAEQGPTEAELARAKRQTLASLIYSSQSAQGMASRLARDTLSMKDPDYLSKYVEAIQKITAGDVKAAAQAYLRRDRLITVSLLPAPDGAEPEPLVRPEPANLALKQEPVVLDNAVLIDKLRHAEADQAGGQLEVTDVERFVLPNGLRVLVHRNTQTPSVAMQLYHFGGLLGDAPGKEGLSNAAASMLSKGTKKRSALEIAQFTEGLGADVNTGGGNNTFFITARSLKQDWPQVLGLVAEVTLQPAFPQDEWERMQPRLLAAIDRQADRWAGELRLRFRETYFGDHPWSQPPTGRREAIAETDAGQLRAYYMDRLAAKNCVLAVFGDVEMSHVRTAVRKHFSAMPSDAKVAFKPAMPAANEAAIHQFNTDKPLTAVQIGFGPGITRTSPDYPAMQVLSTVLSDFPSGKLEQQLRGRGPGLVYAVGAYNVTGLVNGYFTVLFNSGAERVAEAIRRSMYVINQAREVEVDQQTLARAKAKVLTEEFMSKQSNSARATSAALDHLYGLGLDESDSFLKQVEQIDAARLREVARKYLRNPIIVVMSRDKIDEAALRDAATGELAPETNAKPMQK